MFSNVISPVLRDSDTDSENVNIDTAFCIRWPEKMRFKGYIIDRSIINVFLEAVYGIWFQSASVWMRINP